MSIGTLLAYSLVAVCVLILRYQPGSLNSASQSEKLVELIGEEKVAMTAGDSADEDSPELESRPLKERFSWRLLLNPICDSPTKTSGAIVYVTTAIISVLFTVLCVVLAVWPAELLDGQPGPLVPCVLLIVLSVFCTAIIWRQPESKEALTFKVPLLPLLPLVSIFINVYLMMQLELVTWCRFAVWMFIGFLIYFAYGMWHSTEGAGGSSQKYEPALQSKTPIYLGRDESEVEAMTP